MKIVIYCRFSSELQNPKSLDDQEREIRTGLARLGIDASNADVISDAAVSGTRTDRDGFDQIDKRIKSGEPFLLAADDQSRFTSGTRCTEKARVPAAKAKAVLLEFVANLLKGMPDWITADIDEMRRTINEFHERVPAELEELRSQLSEADRRYANLMRIAESGGVDDIENSKQRLHMADDEVKRCRNDVKRIEAISPAQAVMPDNKWIEARLNEIANALQAEEAGVARILRDLKHFLAISVRG
jgi:hypothetical protein